MNENYNDIIKIIQEGSPRTMQNELEKYHPSDVAETFNALDYDDQMHVLMTLNHHLLADIFSHLKPKRAASLLFKIDRAKVGRILEVMERDDATDVLKVVNIHKRSEYLNTLDDETRIELEHLIHYQEETAGSIMTTDYIALNKGMDVKDAMKETVHNAETTEGIQRLFVLDDKKFLEGVIELKTLIQARSPKKIEELMFSDVITAKVNDDIEDVARKMQNYGIYLLPVVDDHNQLQGVITMDDAADILDMETDEDYARFASISKDENINRSVFKSALHRLPWLSLLLAIGLLVGGIMSTFEETIEQVTVLVFFLPLIMDMGGNTGTQSLAVTVRGISRQHYLDKEARKKHIIKEFKVGILNGVGIGLLAFVTAGIFLTVIGQMGIIEPTHPAFLVSFAIGLSVGVALIITTVFGAIVPLTLHRLKFDPAVASGPFITTVNDVLGLLIYFLIAGAIILWLPDVITGWGA